ncbi:unnamed protein product, partial [marine sediment metagenome]
EGFGVANFAQGGGTLDATYNWWGDPSGPSGVGLGSGDAVSANVDYRPWLDAPYQIGAARSFNVLNESTGAEFDTIQAAVDAADNGDTILVHPGTYEESVVVDVENLTLIGVGDPVLDASDCYSGFSIQASGVTIDSFTVMNATSDGIRVYDENIEGGSVTIRNNVIGNNPEGILFDGNISNSTITIENNLIQSCYAWETYYGEGIDFYNWVDNIWNSRIVIENNRIINNSDTYAVDLDAEIYSSEIVIVGNTIDSNGYDGI